MNGEASVAPAETKSLRTCDIFFCCSKDGRSLYDSTAWSDLCPVMDFMCLISQLWSDRTVTAVALRQWLVRCGSIPVRLLMFFSIFQHYSCFSASCSTRLCHLLGGTSDFGRLLVFGKEPRKSGSGDLSSFLIVFTGHL